MLAFGSSEKMKEKERREGMEKDVVRGQLEIGFAEFVSAT